MRTHYVLQLSLVRNAKNIIVKTVPARIKQASDIPVVSKYCKILKVLNKNFAIIKAQKLYFETISDYTKILDTCDDYPNTIEGLVKCNKTFIDKFSDQLNSEHQALIGEIYEGI